MNRFLACLACLTASLTAAADPLSRIAEIEDARDAASPELRALAADPAPEVRARVARAIGRMLDPDLLDAGLALLGDRDPEVRRGAAWALGQFGFRQPPTGREPELTARIAPLLRDADERMRATAIEAIGKLGGPGAPSLALALFADPSPRVRAEAAFACFRWRQVLRMQGKTGDLPALPAPAAEGLLRLAADPDPEVRWRALYAFARVPDWRAAPLLALHLDDGNAWARLFAVRALTVAKALGSAPAIATRAEDPEACVRLEAVLALTALGRTDLLPAKLAQDPSFHVRAALAASGRADLLDALESDPSASVRAAALTARAQGAGASALPRLEKALAAPDWVVREAAVTAAGAAGADALPLVLAAAQDPDERVRAAAIETAGAIEGPLAFEALRRAAAAPGRAERGTAVEALVKRAEPEAWDLLVRAWADSPGQRWVEVRETIVDAAKDSTRPEATAFLQRVLAADPEASVQAKAIAALSARGVTDLPSPSKPALTHSPHGGTAPARNPVVLLETSRGNVAIECFAHEAPFHVANFVGMARAGGYDGLDIHRVVPNFVVQGCDPERTGWGDAGYALRAEINEERYLRGTLGMPRAAGFDTGGCQIFVTHVPTPHLDGLYTVFGRVIEGLDVIDRLERGDVIGKARVRE